MLFYILLCPTCCGQIRETNRRKHLYKCTVTLQRAACISGKAASCMTVVVVYLDINHVNAELNPVCHFLALLGAHHILHVSGLRVNIL